MPVYDKPMIYYPLSTLNSGRNQVRCSSSPHRTTCLCSSACWATGSQIGCRFSYKVQEVPNGLAQAFVIGKEFIGSDKVALVLGNNIFYGAGMSQLLQANSGDPDGGVVYAYHVQDPERYGVVEFGMTV